MKLLTDKDRKLILDEYRPVVLRHLKKLKMGEWKSPPEIHAILKHSGINHDYSALCVAIIEMHKSGELELTHTDEQYWKIPLFRLPHPCFLFNGVMANG